MNIDVLGISKLKWTGMGEFNSDDPYICYCGQESLRRNGVAPLSRSCSITQPPLEWGNLTQMTIVSSTVGRNLLEEME